MPKIRRMRTPKSANSTVATPDNKWNEVLAAAIDVFDDKGYKAATVQDIAQELRQWSR